MKPLRPRHHPQPAPAAAIATITAMMAPVRRCSGLTARRYQSCRALHSDRFNPVRDEETRARSAKVVSKHARAPGVLRDAARADALAAPQYCGTEILTDRLGGR